MKAKLTLDGKEFDIEIYDPAMIEMLTSQAELGNTGYERVKDGEHYYSDDGVGNIEELYESHDSVDKECYDSGNYYSDSKLANDNARADALIRKLRRFAAEENEECINWEVEGYKCVICYDHSYGNLTYHTYESLHSFGAIVFDSIKGVKKAMEIFRDDLIWYFTEYKDSLRGVNK